MFTDAFMIDRENNAVIGVAVLGAPLGGADFDITNVKVTETPKRLRDRWIVGGKNGTEGVVVSVSLDDIYRSADYGNDLTKAQNAARAAIGLGPTG